MFTFYLRQIFFPYWMGFNYPIVPVGHPTISNFILPALVTPAVIAALIYLGKSSRKVRIGTALFLLPLIPAMNATAFSADQIVHDRYLYLPLLGVLMILVTLVSKFLTDRNLLIAAVVLSIPLFIQT